MQINQLPDANRFLQSTDWLAIDDADGVTKKVSADRIGISPYVATITSGQWSGSGSDYYITVNASNVTADSILIPHYDKASMAYLKAPVWCVPAAGSFTIHTGALPTGTVTVLVQFCGVMGEAQYQVLADVYSTSQALAKADVVNNLSSGETMPPSAGCVYDAIADVAAKNVGSNTLTGNVINAMKNMPKGSVTYWANSNEPTNAPTGMNYGSYTIFRAANGYCTAIVVQQSQNKVAFVNGVDPDIATTITWIIK